LLEREAGEKGRKGDVATMRKNGTTEDRETNGEQERERRKEEARERTVTITDQTACAGKA
jgi:hypothetical protein